MTTPTTAEAQAEATRQALNTFGAPLAEASEEFDLLVSIPTIAVGDEWKEGQVMAGNFVALERLVSPKFKLSKEKDPATGHGVSYRLVLERRGAQIGIWTTGELMLLGKRLLPGQPVSITYKGKQLINEQNQHTFDYKVGKVPAQMN